MNNWRWSAKKKKILCIAVTVILFSCLAVIGCAPTRLYSVNMNYDAEKAVVPAYMKAGDKVPASTIAVAEFGDVRQVDDQMVIGRVVEKDGMKTLVVPKHTKPTQAVAAGIKSYLVKAGYKISGNIAKWDLKEETMPKSNAKIIIGGNIEELELTCRTGFPTDSYKAKMKFTLVIADAAKGKILYRSSVESNSSLEHVSFSEARLEKQINVALGEAIEKIFEDRKIARSLKEAMIE
jgi:hypothetical protein